MGWQRAWGNRGQAPKFEWNDIMIPTESATPKLVGRLSLTGEPQGGGVV